MAKFIDIVAKTTFDANKAQEASTKAEKRYLFRVGGYALKVAKRSLRKAQKYSEPGQSPNGKTDAMRRGMAFVVEMDARSVIVGPQRDSTKDNALKLHEYGGSRSGAKAGYFDVPKKSVRTEDIDPQYPVRKSKRKGHVKVFMPAGKREYPARPYMGPALKKTTEQDQTKFWTGPK